MLWWWCNKFQRLLFYIIHQNDIFLHHTGFKNVERIKTKRSTLIEVGPSFCPTLTPMAMTTFFFTSTNRIIRYNLVSTGHIIRSYFAVTNIWFCNTVPQLLLGYSNSIKSTLKGWQHNIRISCSLFPWAHLKRINCRFTGILYGDLYLIRM